MTFIKPCKRKKMCLTWTAKSLPIDLAKYKCNKHRKSGSRFYTGSLFSNLTCTLYHQKCLSIKTADIGIKIVERNINNCKHANDTTLLAGYKKILLFIYL